MQQLKISLDDILRGALEEAAKKSGRSLGAEIRNRLFGSLNEDEKIAKEPELQGLLSQIVQLAHITGSEYGRWHADANANKIFAAAAAEQILSHEPKDWGGEHLAADQIKTNGGIVVGMFRARDRQMITERKERRTGRRGKRK